MFLFYTLLNFVALEFTSPKTREVRKLQFASTPSGVVTYIYLESGKPRPSGSRC